MQRREMIQRTKDFALRIIRLASKLPRDRVADMIGRQLVRSGTSIGANYREASRAATKRHFTSIMTVALREADETLYWLELLRDGEILRANLLAEIIDECEQLVAILTASVKKASQGPIKKNSARGFVLTSAI